MAYDDESPQMNIEAARVPNNNPHDILQQISDIDAHIENKKAERRELVNRYEELMKGFEKHAAQVLFRPEQGEVAEPVEVDRYMVKASGRSW